MKLTKLGHSCVLVEIDNLTVLFDPGGWSDKNLIDVISKLDIVIYTHDHGDHFDIEILKSIASKSPELKVISNIEIQELIRNAQLTIEMAEESKSVIKFNSPHEKLPFPGAIAPAQNGYHFNDLFTHPGDGQSFHETKKVLAMPFIGPWGKLEDSVNKVLELQPEYVLPIHDWHYREEAKEWLQEKLEPVMASHGIKLLPFNNGELIEI